MKDELNSPSYKIRGSIVLISYSDAEDVMNHSVKMSDYCHGLAECLNTDISEGKISEGDLNNLRSIKVAHDTDGYPWPFTSFEKKLSSKLSGIKKDVKENLSVTGIGHKQKEVIEQMTEMAKILKAEDLCYLYENDKSFKKEIDKIAKIGHKSAPAEKTSTDYCKKLLDKTESRCKVLVDFGYFKMPDMYGLKEDRVKNLSGQNEWRYKHGGI